MCDDTELWILWRKAVDADDAKNFEVAKHLYDKCLELAKEEGDLEIQLCCNDWFGHIAAQEINLEDTDMFFKQSLEIAEKLHDKHSMANALAYLAHNEADKGNRKAIEMANRILDIYIQENDMNAINRYYYHIVSLPNCWEKNELIERFNSIDCGVKFEGETIIRNLYGESIRKKYLNQQ